MELPMKTRCRPRLWIDAFWAAVNPEVAIVGFQRTEPGWLSAPTDLAQPDFDLWYVASGRGAVQVDGIWRQFSAGDLLCLKPGNRYQRERTDDADPFHLYYAHLLPFGRRDGGLNEALAAVWPLQMSVLHRPEFLRLFALFFEAYATRPAHDSLTVKGLALQLLDVVFDELQHAPRGPRSGGHVGVLQAKALIETSYAEPLTIPDMAAAAGLCASHLSALFSRQMGVSPFEYLLRVRIREARLLLARGLRVKEVAQRTGFHSQHYFCRQFRQRTGQTPTDFAQQSRWRNHPPSSRRSALPT
jgi:AraC-like DNA-binding protein